MKRYSYIIKREVSSIEEVHAVIVAKNERQAMDTAEAIGEGGATIYPSVERYNVYDREETDYDLISLELVDVDD